MSDYIRRQDVVMQLSHNKRRGDDEWELAVESDMDIIRKMPSADVVQVRHGKWIKEWWHGERTRKCSACNITQTVNAYKGEVKFNYCPYCGAKMDAQGERRE